MENKLNKIIKPESPIMVTQPDLPDIAEFLGKIEEIWKNKWLTNNGSFHQEFEKQLTEFLGVKHLSLFSNGTLALITALQALEIKGEVITTPYSFVATTHALTWNNITPVFADVDPVFGNIDPDKIEALITPKTTAIMPVHVYGNPVHVKKIEQLAEKYGLKVIYDAAHAFGVELDGKSVLNYGNLSILSFHATKAFNTIEGGAIISHDLKTKQKIDLLKNFGFVDEVTVIASGINAKMNELVAAYGLIQLKHFDDNNLKRKMVSQTYFDLLSDVKGIRLLKSEPDVKYNHAYFPIFVGLEYPLKRDELYEKLKQNNVFGRRYFYPLISNFPIYNHIPSAAVSNLPIANIVSEQVICLPMYSDLGLDQVKLICDIIKSI